MTYHQMLDSLTETNVPLRYTWISGRGTIRAISRMVKIALVAAVILVISLYKVIGLEFGLVAIGFAVFVLVTSAVMESYTKIKFLGFVEFNSENILFIRDKKAVQEIGVKELIDVKKKIGPMDLSRTDKSNVDDIKEVYALEATLVMINGDLISFEAENDPLTPRHKIRLNEVIDLLNAYIQKRKSAGAFDGVTQMLNEQSTEPKT